MGLEGLDGCSCHVGGCWDACIDDRGEMELKWTRYVYIGEYMLK
jgi:hypothetical protein